MQSKIWFRLRLLASGLALACLWFDFSLREAPRPQVASYDWRRTVDGWEEQPRWRAPQQASFVRPLMVAGLLFGASAAALSPPQTSPKRLRSSKEPAAE